MRWLLILGFGVPVLGMVFVGFVMQYKDYLRHNYVERADLRFAEGVVRVWYKSLEVGVAQAITDDWCYRRCRLFHSWLRSDVEAIEQCRLDLEQCSVEMVKKKELAAALKHRVEIVREVEEQGGSHEQEQSGGPVLEEFDGAD